MTNQPHLTLRLLLAFLAFAVTVIALITLSPTLFKWSVSEERFINAPQKLLVVFAHTDDEVTNSGLIHYLASQGTEITLLTLTDGSANPRSDLGACTDGETITDCRMREVRSAAKLMGIKHVETPLLPDSKLMEHLPQAVQAVSAELIKTKPEAILTMEPSGLNGLADHRAAFASVAKAVTGSVQKPIILLSTLPWPISFFLPTEISTELRHKRRVFHTKNGLRRVKISVAEAHKSQASTINGLTLGLGPDRLFKWIDFETYSIHESDDLPFLQAKKSQKRNDAD